MSYGRLSNATISRQFTESEEALDPRVTELITQPLAPRITGNSLQQSYHWMKKDLEMRSMLSDQLGKEQSMAYAQSSRHALAKQSEEKMESEIAATNAMRRARQLVDSEGLDFNQAIYRVSGEDDSLALNPAWNQMAKEMRDFYESDEDRALKEAKKANEMLKLNVEAKPLQDLWDIYQTRPDDVAKIASLKFDTDTLNSANANLAANTQNLQRIKEFKEAQENARLLLEEADLDSDALESQATVQNWFEDNGINTPNSSNIGRYLKNHGSLALMIGSKEWMASNFPTPEDRAIFTEALEILSENKLPEGAGEEDRQAALQKSREAKALISGHLGRYLKETKDVSGLTTRSADISEKKIARIEQSNKWTAEIQNIANDNQMPNRGVSIKVYALGALDRLAAEHHSGSSKAEEIRAIQAEIERFPIDDDQDIADLAKSAIKKIRDVSAVDSDVPLRRGTMQQAAGALKSAALKAAQSIQGQDDAQRSGARKLIKKYMIDAGLDPWMVDDLKVDQIDQLMIASPPNNPRPPTPASPAPQAEEQR
jgi:hypothetical protein